MPVSKNMEIYLCFNPDKQHIQSLKIVIFQTYT